MLRGGIIKLKSDKLFSILCVLGTIIATIGMVFGWADIIPFVASTGDLVSLVTLSLLWIVLTGLTTILWVLIVKKFG